jgi:hypothetical protein
MKKYRVGTTLKALMGILFFLNLVDTAATWIGVKVLRIGVEMNPLMDFILNFNSLALWIIVKMSLISISLSAVVYGIKNTDERTMSRLVVPTLVGLNTVYIGICVVHSLIFWEHFYG